LIAILKALVSVVIAKLPANEWFSCLGYRPVIVCVR